MKIKLFILILFCVSQFLQSVAQENKSKKYKIQIALLLDVSGSMDGLLAQAKGQIWRMVNELTMAEKNNQTPEIQIALGTFGNADFKENGYFKLYTPLTTDIDLISESLFDLQTGGSEEFCGYSIQYTLDSLEWSESKEDLKIIFLAGNEEFNLGPTDYAKAGKNAVKKNIIVNTIFCGKEEDGIKNLWSDGAKTAKGKFMVINQDSAIVYAETFWDQKIIAFNDRFNSTYIPYGIDAEKKLDRQIKQDENAILLGSSFMRDRVIFKASDSYDNAQWDLVDLYKNDSNILSKLDVKLLPDNMKTMTIEKKKQYLGQKIIERDLYKDGIKVYYAKAKDLIRLSSGNMDISLTLDNTILNIIKEQADKKGFVFK